MAMTPEKWSISALAVELQMDRRTIAKCIKDVEPCGKERTALVYRMADVVKAIYAPSSSSGNLDVTAETARLKKFQADKTELEVEVLKGNLLHGETVQATWADFIGACRAKLVALPSTAAPRVTGLSVSEVETELRDLIHPALEELKEYEPGHYGATGSTQADQVSSEEDGAAAGSDGKRVGRRKKAPVKRGKRGTGKMAD